MSTFKTLDREQVSNDLLWGITQRNNCFLFKNLHGTFSHDPLNLTGQNLKKFSSVACDQAVSVNIHEIKRTVKSKKAKKEGNVLRSSVVVKGKSTKLADSKLKKLEKNPHSNNLFCASQDNLTPRQAFKTARSFKLLRRDLHDLLFKKLVRVAAVKRNHVTETKKAEKNSA